MEAPCDKDSNPISLRIPKQLFKLFGHTRKIYALCADLFSTVLSSGNQSLCRMLLSFFSELFGICVASARKTWQLQRLLADYAQNKQMPSVLPRRLRSGSLRNRKNHSGHKTILFQCVSMHEILELHFMKSCNLPQRVSFLHNMLFHTSGVRKTGRRLFREAPR